MDILGVDIGGTFTDFVLLRDGRLVIHKLLSTPDDPARALLEGVAALGAPDALVHGTTVATNALLERRGAPTALITTAGFRDVLAIGRGERPALYDIDVTRPEPLVPDAWRLELVERMDHTGKILCALDPAELEQLVSWLVASPIMAVAVCLLHAYANPVHEQLVVEALEPVAGPDGDGRFVVSASHRVLPEQREYERTSTTVVNAYVAPVLRRYLGELGEALTQQGVRSLRIMASDGGSMGLATARELPARATLSGPAGGVVGARYIAGRAGHQRIISFDMGGTSTDVALCDDALPQTGESRVAGLPVRLPSLDIHTVGAGGGSLARIDAGGALRVGPASAGADPGPACYGKGTQPTVTDANLLLGRLRADYFLGGRMTLDAGRARAALAPIAEALAADGEPASDEALLRAALGVVRVANAAMERAIRTISIERGDDPRDYTLVAFGGAGPLHAVHLAEALDMRRVLVPRYPGVLSALGMLAADVTRDASQALLQPLDDLDVGELGRRMADLAQAGLAALAADGEPAERCRVDFALDLRYRGQSYEISTPLVLDEGRRTKDERSSPSSFVFRLSSKNLAAAADRFHALHERRYGHAMPERAVEAVTLRMKAIGARPALAYDVAGELPPRPGPLAPRATISAALENDTATLAPASLYHREDMRPGDVFSGPAVVVQLDATTIIPAGWRAEVDQDAQLLLTAER